VSGGLKLDEGWFPAGTVVRFSVPITHKPTNDPRHGPASQVWGWSPMVGDRRLRLEAAVSQGPRVMLPSSSSRRHAPGAALPVSHPSRLQEPCHLLGGDVEVPKAGPFRSVPVGAPR
jgi:hypothetical protein